MYAIGPAPMGFHTLMVPDCRRVDFSVTLLGCFVASVIPLGWAHRAISNKKSLCAKITRRTYVRNFTDLTTNAAIGPKVVIGTTAMGGGNAPTLSNLFVSMAVIMRLNIGCPH